jgi:triacylglycerol lipase
MKIDKCILAGITLSTTLFISASMAQSETLPIVFVHGDSDTSALWITQMWRFESNGYSSNHMFALDLTSPGAPQDNNVKEKNRSTTSDAASALSVLVDKALQSTGAAKVALIGNSRGCSTIRNYVQNFGGAEKVAKMVMSGCVYNGVFNFPDAAVGSEYNASGTFLKTLNAGVIIPDGVEVATIRSDKFDLYNQPMGDFIGMAGKPTGGNYAGPELKGAANHVLANADHRETAFSAEAFALIYKAVIGSAPDTLEISTENSVILNGKVSGWENARPTNIPLAGASVTVYKTDATTGKRAGGVVHEKTIGENGEWGPFSAAQNTTYEFVITAAGHPITHIYRSAFPRSSSFVNLRLYPLEGNALTAKYSLGMMRPRGYYGARQDRIEFNGVTAKGLIDHDVPSNWKVFSNSNEVATITGSFNGEKITGQSWPVKGHAAWLELTY